MSAGLEALSELVSRLSDTDRAAFDKSFKELRRIWYPSIGPQTAAYLSNANLLLFGGSAGGGKTDLLLGLALSPEHERSVIFRRQSVDMRGLEERLIEIIGDNNYNRSDRIYRVPGRLIEMGHLERPGAELSWQGRPHDLICVQKGTPVMMSDGSYKAVDKIVFGDMVYTLEGARRVTKTFEPRKRNGVRVTAYAEDGSVIASQVQSSNHSVLKERETLAFLGRSSSVLPFSTSLPKALLSCRKAFLRFFVTFLPPLRSLSILYRGLRRRLSQWRSLPWSGHPCEPGIFSFAGQVHLDTSSAAIDGASLKTRQPLVSTALQVRPQPASRSDALECIDRHSFFSRGKTDAQRRSLPEDLTDRCSYDPRQCDERIPLFWGPCSGEGGDRLCLLRPVDAGQSIPIDYSGGGGEQTPRHTLRTRSYAHPYRKDVRQTSEALVAFSYSAEPLGELDDLFDLEVDELNHYVTAGGFVNKNCFDEGAQLTAQKVNFVLGWLRSSTGKRCRAVIASNPPIGGEGEWLIEWFAPWLDPAHDEYPTPFGDLRWAVVMGSDDEIRTIWVDSAHPIMMEGITGAWRLATQAEIASPKHPPNYMIPLSRTFIPSKLDDNPFLRDTNYRAQINAMPEPLRSQLLHGDFLAGRKDHRQQIIPTEWVLRANDRWRAARDKKRKMLHMGVDVAQGGSDFTTIAKLYTDASFDPTVRVPGVETPDGPSVAALILTHRRNDAGITVDLGGGWGGSTRDMLKTHHDIIPYGFVPGAKSGANDKSHKLGFYNVRAEAWWKFREDLDPEAGSEVKLPPDARLQAQLTTPRWELRGTKIIVEDKDEIRTRLGSSPDDADAVIMCWHHRKRSIATQNMKEAARNGTADPVDNYNPLAGF